ncbi:MAG: carbon storage regulator CsrA [Bacillota bacterium]
MLVLSRKTGESLTIGQDILIEVIAVEGDRVRLGIQAPREIRIFRSELLEETISINKSAASAPPIAFSLKPSE